MDEAYFAKLIKKVNDGVQPQEWFDDVEDEGEMEQQTIHPDHFRLNPPRRLWEQIRALPQYKAGVSSSGRGRPRLHSPKKVFSTILTKAYYAYPTWREFDVMFGIPSSTAYDQFRRWKKSGLFDELSALRVQCHHGRHEIDWAWIKMFDRFKENLEPEREPKESASMNEMDEKMYRRLYFTARGTPRKNRIQAHILRGIRGHFHRSA